MYKGNLKNAVYQGWDYIPSDDHSRNSELIIDIIFDNNWFTVKRIG